MNDTKIMAAMKLYGNGFEKALASAAMAANTTELWIIKGAFPELWQEYKKLADNREYQSQYKGESIPVPDSQKYSPFGYRNEPPEEGEL